MQVELTPEQRSFISLGIREGRFRDHEEAVQQAMSEWETRQRARLNLLETLDSAQTALDAGAGTSCEVADLGQLAQSITRSGALRRASQSCK